MVVLSCTYLTAQRKKLRLRFPKTVIARRKLTMQRDGQTLPSASHVLTFSRSPLPEKVSGVIHMLSLRAFFLQPMHCFQSLLFAHCVKMCSGKTCFYGKPAHGNDPCATPMNCVNCGGQHSSTSRNFFVYKQGLLWREYVP